MRLLYLRFGSLGVFLKIPRTQREGPIISGWASFTLGFVLFRAPILPTDHHFDLVGTDVFMG
jgi:hypothetical protein